MYTLHTHCRACGYARSGPQGIKSPAGERLVEVLDLGIQPLANDFRKDGESHAGHAPLKVLFCPQCSLAQLSVVVEPSIMYWHYPYITSRSEMMQKHFEWLVRDIREETDNHSVLEIGSNDGRLLSMMRDEGYSVLGVDPAQNLVDLAKANGITTQCGFFGEDLSRVLPQSDVIIARHVFCHVDDWGDFIRGVEQLCHKDTLVCIETPYAGDLLKNCEFDTIYHEHLSYLTIKSVRALLANTSLHLHRINRYPIHGGTILVMLRHNDCDKTPHSSLQESSENITVDDWKMFAAETQNQIARLKTTVHGLKQEGKRIAGLGASAKSTVWINACGFTSKEIGFIADNTPQKQLTYSPGSGIPIVDEGAILRELPDYVIMFAWNYREEILHKFALAISRGVKFIIPVKTIEVV